MEGGDDDVQESHRVLQADAVECGHHGMTRQDHRLDDTDHDERPLDAVQLRNNRVQQYYVSWSLPASTCGHLHRGYKTHHPGNVHFVH